MRPRSRGTSGAVCCNAMQSSRRSSRTNSGLLLAPTRRLRLYKTTTSSSRSPSRMRRVKMLLDDIVQKEGLDCVGKAGTETIKRSKSDQSEQKATTAHFAARPCSLTFSESAAEARAQHQQRQNPMARCSLPVCLSIGVGIFSSFLLISWKFPAIAVHSTARTAQPSRPARVRKGEI